MEPSEKHKIIYEKYPIQKVGTHNTLPPFNMEIDKGVHEEIHVIKHIGKEAGPLVYVGGGTHGDEVNGVLAVLWIHRKLKKIQLRGNVILVPLQNPAGYRFRTRLNPYDPIDPDWVHPGDRNGSYTQRMKHILNGLASEADCVIDLHTSSRKGSNNTMVYVPPGNKEEAEINSLNLSLAFGGDRIIYGNNEKDYGWPVQNAMPFVAVRKGKTGIYAEAGTGGSSIPEEKFVNYFVTGVMNVLSEIGVIDGQICKQGERKVVNPLNENSISVKSELPGIFMPKVMVGDRVTKGQILAKIYGIPDGEKEIVSPINGIVMYRHMFGPTSEKDNIVTISPG
ncbi:MAG: succinylglutamate desuccinylase/aspartoacylase family protein [Candidatus Hodarchaeales archaeon]